MLGRADQCSMMYRGVIVSDIAAPHLFNLRRICRLAAAIRPDHIMFRAKSRFVIDVASQRNEMICIMTQYLEQSVAT